MDPSGITRFDFIRDPLCIIEPPKDFSSPDSHTRIRKISGKSLSPCCRSELDSPPLAGRAATPSSPQMGGDFTNFMLRTKQILEDELPNIRSRDSLKVVKETLEHFLESQESSSLFAKIDSVLVFIKPKNEQEWLALEENLADLINELRRTSTLSASPDKFRPRLGSFPEALHTVEKTKNQPVFITDPDTIGFDLNKLFEKS